MKRARKGGYMNHPNSPHLSQQHLTPDHAFDPLDHSTKMSIPGLGPGGGGGGGGPMGGISPMPQGFPPYRNPE